MLRKLFGSAIAIAGVVALTTGVVGSDKMRTYHKTGERWVSEQVDKLEGLPMKLELLRTKVSDLGEEVRRLERGVIQKRLDVDALATRVKEDEQRVERHKRALERAAALLDEGQVRYEINGHTFTRDDIERDARAKLEACRDAERSIDEQKRVLVIRERTLELSRQHLEKARVRRVEIGRELKTIEARIAQHKAKRALAEALETPDVSQEVQTELGRVEKMTKELRDKLAVEEKLIDERLAKTEAGTPGSIDYEAKPAEAASPDTAKAIREYLSPAPTPAPAPTDKAVTPEKPAPAKASIY